MKVEGLYSNFQKTSPRPSRPENKKSNGDGIHSRVPFSICRMGAASIKYPPITGTKGIKILNASFRCVPKYKEHITYMDMYGNKFSCKFWNCARSQVDQVILIGT
jgi:hypothetical protein